MGQRRTFTGQFERFGEKRGYKTETVPTVCFTQITDVATNEIVTHYLWFNLTKAFKRLDLKPGDIVQFDARVDDYVKGYFGYRVDVYKPAERDFRLVYPTKVKLLSQRSS
jgi:hypothetical protein